MQKAESQRDTKTQKKSCTCWFTSRIALTVKAGLVSIDKTGARNSTWLTMVMVRVQPIGH